MSTDIDRSYGAKLTAAEQEMAADFVKQVAGRPQKLSTRCFLCGKQLEMGNYMFDVASKNYVCLRCYKPNLKAK